MHTPPLILMADDDNNFREIIMTKLTALGFDVRGVTNAKDAIAQAAALQPDLILMDVNMPGEMNGIDAAFQLKEVPETKDLRICFLSSVADPWPGMVGDKAAVSKAFGMEDFIAKTEDLNVFVEKVEHSLGMQNQEAAPPAQEMQASEPAAPDAAPPAQ